MLWRIHRKERGRSMPNLTDIIDEAQAEARATCTQCLIDYLHEETGELTGKFATLAAATAQRGSARDGEARYAEAFTEVMRTRRWRSPSTPLSCPATGRCSGAAPASPAR